MRRLTLLAVPECPLSAHGRQILAGLTADRLLSWQEVAPDTEAGRILQVDAPELLPALFDESGLLLAHGRLSEKRLRLAFTPPPVADGAER
jgi:hypothetical protein